MIVKLLIEGGNMTPSPAIAQKLGPLGINIGQVISDVNKATTSFKGIKVPVELDIDTSTKKFTINVFSPPVPEMIKKELGIETGSGDHKKVKVGNIAFEKVLYVAKTKLPTMLERDLKAAVKTVVGSCVSLGVLIDNKYAVDVAKEIEEGVYDKEIKSENTDVSPEKMKQLNDFFSQLSSKQDAILKKEEAEKEQSEKSKISSASKAPVATTTAKTAAAKPAAKTAAAKPAAKKK
jgi:large subunit ribosomal protein L11